MLRRGQPYRRSGVKCGRQRRLLITGQGHRCHWRLVVDCLRRIADGSLGQGVIGCVTAVFPEATTSPGPTSRPASGWSSATSLSSATCQRAAPRSSSRAHNGSSEPIGSDPYTLPRRLKNSQRPTRVRMARRAASASRSWWYWSPSHSMAIREPSLSGMTKSIRYLPIWNCGIGL